VVNQLCTATLALKGESSVVHFEMNFLDQSEAKFMTWVHANVDGFWMSRGEATAEESVNVRDNAGHGNQNSRAYDNVHYVPVLAP